MIDRNVKLTKTQGIRFLLSVYQLFRHVTYEKGMDRIWIRLENIDHVDDVRPNVRETTFRAYIKLSFHDGEFQIHTWMPRGEYKGIIERIEAAFKEAAESTEEVEYPEYIYNVPLKKIVEDTLE